jgi:hypothetical protein
MMRHTQEILDVATTGCGPSQDMLILVDRQGALRVLDPAGWSQTGIDAEYAAVAVYKVERRGNTVRVEGRSGSEQCLIQRNLAPIGIRDLPGMSFVCHPMLLQAELPAT